MAANQGQGVRFDMDGQHHIVPYDEPSWGRQQQQPMEVDQPTIAAPGGAASAGNDSQLIAVNAKGPSLATAGPPPHVEPKAMPQLRAAPGGAAARASSVPLRIPKQAQNEPMRDISRSPPMRNIPQLPKFNPQGQTVVNNLLAQRNEYTVIIPVPPDNAETQALRNQLNQSQLALRSQSEEFGIQLAADRA